VDIRENTGAEIINRWVLATTIYREQPFCFFVPEGTSVMWKDSYLIHRPGGEANDRNADDKAGWG
jgi:hypothetical protein